MEGNVLTIRTLQGDTSKISLPEGMPLVAPKRMTIADIKPGSFIGTAAVPGPGGELQSLEVVVFPESMRGSGEGHYAWDLTPASSMTNATVDAVVESTNGRDLKLSYKGGSVNVLVPEKAPIVTPVPAEMSDLKPGAAVFLVATKQPDGSFAGVRAWVAKDGVAPPM
jgi:hypothetical protein